LATEVTSAVAFLTAAVASSDAVLAGGQHQLDGFHLHFLRDFGEGGQVFGSHLGSGRSEVGHRLGVVGRLGLGFGHVGQLGDRVLGPFRAEISVDFSAASSATFENFSAKAAWVLKAFWNAEASTGNEAIMSCMTLVKSGVLVISVSPGVGQSRPVFMSRIYMLQCSISRVFLQHCSKMTLACGCGCGKPWE
jgi:hypothetical protein